MKVLFKLTIGLLFLGFCWGSFRVFQIIQSPTAEPRIPIYYEVEKNQRPKKIVQDLGTLGVLKYPKIFYIYLKSLGLSQKIKAADYRFFREMGFQECMDTLFSGVPFGIPITIPEGWNRFQIADLIRSTWNEAMASDFLKQTENFSHIKTHLPLLQEQQLKLPSLEGFLYPDTYVVPRKTSGTNLVEIMVGHFFQIMKTFPEGPGVLSHPEQLKNLLIMASVIEKETGAPEERPLISSVFHNRLKKRMKLQSDPTVIYGLWSNYKGNLHRSDLSNPHLYNTYYHHGLPVGPIANPGLASLDAALHPATSNYLYFVSKNNGRHVFTENYESHKREVEHYQIDASAREGHSWRELSQPKN